MPANGTAELKVIIHTDFIMLFIAVNMHAKHLLSFFINLQTSNVKLSFT